MSPTAVRFPNGQRVTFGTAAAVARYSAATLFVFELAESVADIQSGRRRHTFGASVYYRVGVGVQQVLGRHHLQTLGQQLQAGRRRRTYTLC